MAVPRVFEAYVGNSDEPLFHADGVAPRQIVLLPNDPVAPAVLANVDRVHLLGSEGLALVLPIVPTTLECRTLHTDGNGTGLEIHARVRCYLAPAATQHHSTGSPEPFADTSIDFTCKLWFGLAGPFLSEMEWNATPATVASLNVDLLTTPSGGAAQPSLDVGETTFAVARWSTLLEKLGLTMPAVPTGGSDNPTFKQSIAVSFFRREDGDGRQRSRFGLAFRSDVTLDSRSATRHRIVPFDMTLDTPTLRTLHDAHRGDRLVLRQRQPTSGDHRHGPAPGAEHWLVELEVPSRFLASHWNEKIVRPYTEALSTVQDGRPLTLLPRLFVKQDEPRWTVGVSIVDTRRRGALALGDICFRMPSSTVPLQKVSVVPRSVALSLVDQGHGPRPLPVTMVFPGFSTTGAAATPLSAHGRIWPRVAPAPPLPTGRSEASLRGEPQGFEIALEQVVSQDTSPQHVRLGALELAFPGAPFEPPTGAGQSYPGVSAGRIEVRRKPGASDGGDTIPPGVVQLERLELELAVLAVSPAGQAAVPGEEFAERFEESADDDEEAAYEARFARHAPLVLTPWSARDGGSGGTTADLRLAIDESALDQRSQTVSLALHDARPDPRGRDYDLLILDRTPFLVAKVEVRDLATDLRDALTSEIANYSTRSGAVWELSAGAQGFDLVLPPQGVGEAMEKNKSGVDLPDIQPVDGVVPPIDFRFTPTARLRLRPSYEPQRFAEAPWNLRRLLGYPGQRAPGAGVDQLDFELLYGMSCRVDAKNLRLAEIAARLGELPGRQAPSSPWRASSTAQTELYRAHRTAWSRLYALLRSRLAILEPWDPTQDQSLVLDDGVEYRLRESAHLRFPVPLRDPADAPSVPPNARDDDGLAGGVAWGFESTNVYDAVWRNPRSVAAVLARPYFSALGGYGLQKASFDRGLTTIYSDTAMGRTFSLTIERLGRIGVFWTRAKHVVVYERTVSPTRQFFAEQDTLEGLPVLRKVREYVEILEPRRRFPDLDGPPVERGFVSGIEFPATSRRINVSSRWGRDVGKEGWQVPLWSRSARPGDVYPKPSILLNLAGDRSDVAIALDEPEKLSFFTSTRADLDADSDTWPAVEGVDFVDLDPGAMAPPVSSFAKGDDRTPNTRPGRTLASDDDAVIIGAGAFTFALQPAGRPVNVVAERTAEAIGAQLRNVTLMRGTRGDGTVSPSVAHEAVRDLAGNALEPLLSALQGPLRGALGTGPGDLERNLAAEIEAAKRRIADADGARAALADALGKLKQDKLCEAVRQRVLTRFDLGTQELLTRLDAVAPHVLAELRKLVKDDAWATGVDVRATFKTIVDRAAEVIGAVEGGTARMRADVALARTQVKNAIDAARAELKALADDLPDWAGVVSQEGEQRVAEVREFVVSLLARLEWIVAEGVQALVGDAANPVHAAVAAARAEVDGAARRLAQEFRAGAARTRDQARAAIEKIAELLPQIDAAADAALGAIESAIGTGSSEVAALVGQLKAFFEAVDRQLSPLPAPRDVFVLVQQAAQEFLSRESARLRAALDAARAALYAKIESLCTSLLPDVGKVTTRLAALLSPAWLSELQGAVGTGIRSADEMLREVERARDEIAREIDGVLTRYVPALTDMKEPVAGVGNAVRLLRAFGEAPRVPNLDFELPGSEALYRTPGIGYYFDAATNAVKLTPLLTKANPLGLDPAAIASTLTPINLRVPSSELLDRIKPDSLQAFDIGKVFPDFAGVKLDGLFSGLKLPKIANDAVKVTHGGDVQSGQGWLQVDVDVPFTGEPITVFSFVGITLRLLDARFRATTRIEAAAGQPPRQTFRGSIKGDWDITVGGFPIAVLVDTALLFEDGGRMRFDVSADRIRLQAVLSFLTEILEQLGYSDSGFSVKILPTGIQSILDLPLPDVQAGTFGLANLHLGCIFELEMAPEFQLGARIYLGSKKAPFTITVFILGGAGWLDVGVKYAPTTGAITTRVSVGITAAASLAIALGPIRGGVYAYFGIAAEYEASNQGYSNLRVGLLLLFRGEVCLLGFLSVGLSLSLEAQYTSGGGLIGRGRISYSIKICWLVTINVTADLEYEFAKSSSSRARAKVTSSTTLAAPAAAPPPPADPDPYLTKAQRYVAMFR
jgi:hypothetical protein